MGLILLVALSAGGCFAPDGSARGRADRLAADPELRRLIAELDHPDAGRRDHATEQLVARRERVIPVLEQVSASDAGPEVKVRARAVIRRIRELIRTVDHGRSHGIPLEAFFNNDGVASAYVQDGNFDIHWNEYGDTYPLEGMPEGGASFSPDEFPEVTFLFPDLAEGRLNNVACEGQVLRLYRTQGYRFLYVLGASEEDSQEATLTLLTPDGERPVPFRLTDWCQMARYGEVPVLEWDHRISPRGWQDYYTSCAMFVQTIRLDPAVPLEGLVLPARPQMHIFALTLQE